MQTYPILAAPRIPNFKALTALGGLGGDEACQLRLMKPRTEAMMLLCPSLWMVHTRFRTCSNYGYLVYGFKDTGGHAVLFYILTVSVMMTRDLMKLNPFCSRLAVDIFAVPGLA